MSPRWATVGNAGLYFYPDEPHRRPHVDVVGPGFNVKIARDTLEWLDVAGKVPRTTLRQVEELLKANLELAVRAFHETSEHRWPGPLDEQKKEHHDG